MNYCKKKESQAPGTEPIELGNSAFGRQGFRSDLAAVTDLMRAGGSLVDIVNEFPAVYMRYHCGIGKAIEFFNAPKAFSKRKVYLLHGSTGLGKTKYVYDTHGYANVYKWNSTGKWFDGYNGQEVLLCDDVRWEADTKSGKSFLNGRTVGWWLNFLDGYPVKVEVKGATRWMISSIVYITTNQDPSTWWKNYSQKEASAPFNRRITKCWSVEEETSSPSTAGPSVPIYVRYSRDM